ncbi:MAG: hypothetical protein H2069_07860 [Legionella sp.]|nr:hypothetical protein [Legionella sp.]
MRYGLGGDESDLDDSFEREFRKEQWYKEHASLASDYRDFEAEKLREEAWYEEHAKLPVFYEKKEGTSAYVQQKAAVPDEELPEIPIEHGEYSNDYIGQHVSKFKFFNTASSMPAAKHSQEPEEPVKDTQLSALR